MLVVAGAGALLALLARRMHPSLPFAKLWLYYSAILGAVVLVFFALVFR